MRAFFAQQVGAGRFPERAPPGFPTEEVVGPMDIDMSVEWVQDFNALGKEEREALWPTASRQNLPALSGLNIERGNERVLDAAIRSKQLSNREIATLLAGGRRDRDKPARWPTAGVSRYHYGANRFPGFPMEPAESPSESMFGPVEKAEAWQDRYAGGERTFFSPRNITDANFEYANTEMRLRAAEEGEVVGAFKGEQELANWANEVMGAGPSHEDWDTFQGFFENFRERRDTELLKNRTARELAEQNLGAARAARMGSIRQGEAAMDSELRRQRLQRTASVAGARRINVRPGAPGLAGLHPAAAVAWMKAQGDAAAAREANMPMMMMMKAQQEEKDKAARWERAARMFEADPTKTLEEHYRTLTGIPPGGPLPPGLMPPPKEEGGTMAAILEWLNLWRGGKKAMREREGDMWDLIPSLPFQAWRKWQERNKP